MSVVCWTPEGVSCRPQRTSAREQQLRKILRCLKNPIPSSFESTKLEPHCYLSNITRPAALCGLDRKAAYNLVCALTWNLHKNFSVPHDPENFLARTNDITDESAKDNSNNNNSNVGTYIVIGSSIMGRVVGHLRALYVSVMT
jgi:hypothetical protein